MSEEPKFICEDIRFGQTNSPRAARFSGYDTQSVYIAMPDGVRLAADIFLPKNLPESEKLPSLLHRTRYWRAAELKVPSNQPDPVLTFFTSYGYAVVRMDVRGTGASFGMLLHEWQAQDIKDTYEIVEWIITQDWSNGKVGSYGVSYPGTTAELLAATGHPAVTSIWATYHELDGFTDIAFPGGIPSRFIDAWSEVTTAQDHNQYPGDDPNVIGVKPVDADPERKLLQAAVQEHAQSHHIGELCDGVIYKDDPMNVIGMPFEEMMVFPKRAAIEASNVPLDIWGSWMDANTADTAIRHFATFKNPLRCVVSAWSHGGGSFHSPFMPPGTPLEIDRPSQFQEIMRYLDQHFHALDSGLPERSLFYYTLGEEKWKMTTVWPPENSSTQTWYFGTNRSLAKVTPDTNGSDPYRVNFDVTTGTQNRWWTEMGGGAVIYADRGEADRKLLVYESEPIDEDMEITGYPVVTLHADSSETDGAFFVYLEDVAPDGKVTYVTEGILRALHRKVSNEKPPYTVFGPYHSYKRKDGAALMPGEVAELKFALFPISALLRKGHRIRIAIAGADKDTFHRIPASGDPLIHIHYGGIYPSSIELPVVKK